MKKENRLKLTELLNNDSTYYYQTNKPVLETQEDEYYDTIYHSTYSNTDEAKNM